MKFFKYLKPHTHRDYYTLFLLILLITLTLITWITPYKDIGYPLYNIFNQEGLENNKTIDYGDYGTVDIDVKEVVNKVYLTPFFPRKLCNKIIDVYDEHINKRQKLHNDDFIKKEDSNHLDNNDMKYEPGMTAHLKEVPDMYKYLMEYIQKRLFPIVNEKFEYFDGRKISPPYILRYDAKNVKEAKMDIHIDNEQIPVIIYLNDDFEGGGTFFPLEKKLVNGRVGDVLFYPGGVTHPHGGRKITSGIRYLLLFSIIDPEV